MIQAVIFDFNGVLIDDESLHFDLFREVLAEEGVRITERQYHDEFLGYDDWGCFTAALTWAGQEAGRGRVDELVARKAARYATRAESGLRVFPGAREAVAALADRGPVAICSGALRPEIEFALRLMGVRDRVAEIVSAEDTTRGKPDPEGYLRALDALRSSADPGLRAGECLVFEDSLAGLDAARSAGMRTVGVAHTYPTDTLRAADPDALLDALTGLTLAWVDRRFGGAEEGQRDG
jgi:HAD superfamily hydrolase (TIGR01509 family)